MLGDLVSRVACRASRVHYGRLSVGDLVSGVQSGAGAGAGAGAGVPYGRRRRGEPRANARG